MLLAKLTSQRSHAAGGRQLTLWGRQELARRIAARTPIATAADQTNVSRPTATKWWHRFCADPDGEWFTDRSSRPHRSPNRTAAKLEARVVSIRRRFKLGPARIAGRLGLVISTVHRILVCHGLNRLA